MTRRAGLVAALLACALAVAPPAEAHGLTGRKDLPIPTWLFGWAAVLVLVASFVALGALWRKPKLEHRDWRPLPWRLDRVLASRALEILAGAVGIFLFLIVIWSGLAGVQNAGENFAPTFVYVVFWVGLVPVSILFGDVYRAFNPWRAAGRAVAWGASRALREPARAPFSYPEGLGRWPAAAGLLAFAALELVAPDGALPRNVAIAALIYTIAMFVGMALYGVEPWSRRGDAFSVYFGLFARLSAFEQRERRIGVRRPLSGLAGLDPVPGTVEFVAVMIGSTTFDGLTSTPLWNDTLDPRIRDVVEALGLGYSDTIAAAVGLIACVSLILLLYQLGLEVARVLVRRPGVDLQAAFVHSLVPIALAYVAAHYVTLLLFQGQAVAYLASDPLGNGWDLFGTADTSIDYLLIGATTIWYIQVAFVVGGHVTALALAHDRALTLHEGTGVALRSQYPMLVVMIAFTTLALWLLSQANA